jgi:hypothetical protein
VVRQQWPVLPEKVPLRRLCQKKVVRTVLPVKVLFQAENVPTVLLVIIVLVVGQWPVLPEKVPLSRLHQ